MGRKQQRLESRMKQLDVADAHRADRIAVIGQLEMEKGVFGPGFRMALLPVLHRHLQRDFHRRRAIVRIKHTRQPFGAMPNEFTRQLYRRRIGKTEQRGVGDFLELRLERTVERRMPMTVQIDPDGRRAIEIFSPFRIDEVGALAALNDERFFLFPFLHLGKGMPEVAVRSQLLTVERKLSRAIAVVES